MGQLRLKMLQLSNVTSFSIMSLGWVFGCFLVLCTCCRIPLLVQSIDGTVTIRDWSQPSKAALPCLVYPRGLELSILEMYYLWYGMVEMETGTGLGDGHSTRKKLLSVPEHLGWRQSPGPLVPAVPTLTS